MDSLTKAIDTVERFLVDYDHYCAIPTDETISAIEEILAAAIYMDRGEIDSPKRDEWESPIRSPFHKPDCYRRDEHLAPDHCAVD